VVTGVPKTHLVWSRWDNT